MAGNKDEIINQRTAGLPFPTFGPNLLQNNAQRLLAPMRSDHINRLHPASREQPVVTGGGEKQQAHNHKHHATDLLTLKCGGCEARCNQIDKHRPKLHQGVKVVY